MSLARISPGKRPTISSSGIGSKRRVSSLVSTRFRIQGGDWLKLPPTTCSRLARRDLERTKPLRSTKKKERLMQTKTNREPLYAPYDWYRQMRETQPVYHDPDWGAWHVFRYADVARVLSDYATFSSDESRYMQPEYRDSSPISSSILR